MCKWLRSNDITITRINAWWRKQRHLKRWICSSSEVELTRRNLSSDAEMAFNYVGTRLTQLSTTIRFYFNLSDSLSQILPNKEVYDVTVSNR